MDDKVAANLLAFNQQVEELKKATSMEEFTTTKACVHIRQCLYIYELMAVGIHNKIFDQRICYDYWSDELNKAYNSAKSVIDFDRAQPGSGETYSDLIRLQKKWSGPHWIWQCWRSRWWPLRL
jgi:hypothetical protein